MQYKCRDKQGKWHDCKPSPYLTNYIVYTCQCGTEHTLCIEWCFNRGYEYCSKCMTPIWEFDIIKEIE